jgi:DNA-binding NarL/FixJ family response regulator
MKEFPVSLSVYVVEDSSILRRLLTSTIEAAGAELVGASGSAQAAIADLTALQPDLVLIDISLDSGSGFDVLRELRARGLVPGAMKAVLTNHANSEYEKLSYRLGANRFFDKASQTSQVLALISALAANKRRGDSGSRPGHDDPGEMDWPGTFRADLSRTGVGQPLIKRNEDGKK